jgi:chromatin assembly factor 1 subunit A
VKRSLDAALGLSRPTLPPVPEARQKLTGEGIAELLHIPPRKLGRRGKTHVYTTKELLARINAPDYYDDSSPAEPLKMLNSLPRKFLRFAEDVRPPYSGTFARRPTARGLLMGRNPFMKALPRVDYDYDSEAEWEEGAQDEEVEELLSDDAEDEDEGESVDEEMDGFLDDEMEDRSGKVRRGGVVAALVPVCSNLCWEDGRGRNLKREFESMRIGVLLGEFLLPL